jgi:hypothetical protein
VRERQLIGFFSLNYGGKDIFPDETGNSASYDERPLGRKNLSLLVCIFVPE